MDNKKEIKTKDNGTVNNCWTFQIIDDTYPKVVDSFRNLDPNEISGIIKV